MSTLLLKYLTFWALFERKMFQADLAGTLGKSPAHTNQTLSGRKSASPEWVNLVAQALQLSPTASKSASRRGERPRLRNRLGGISAKAETVEIENFSDCRHKAFGWQAL
jgi:hypothetical protein